MIIYICNRIQQIMLLYQHNTRQKHISLQDIKNIIVNVKIKKYNIKNL